MLRVRGQELGVYIVVPSFKRAAADAISLSAGGGVIVKYYTSCRPEFAVNPKDLLQGIVYHPECGSTILMLMAAHPGSHPSASNP